MLIVIFTVISILTAIGFALEGTVAGSGIFALVLTAILAILLISARSENTYKKIALERKTLARRLEFGNEYDKRNIEEEIAEFNHELRRTKKNAKNIVTNWVTNQKIAELDYIELPVAD